MNIAAHLVSLRRSWRTIAALAAAGLALGWILTAVTPVRYASTADVYVSTSGASDLSDMAQGSTFAQKHMRTYANLVKTAVVLQPTIDGLELGTTPQLLAESVSAEVLPDTVLLQIRVENESPAQAALITNTIAHQLTLRVSDLQAGDSQQAAVKASVVQPAVPSTSPSSPKPRTNMILGLILGVFAGAAVAILRDVLDRTVKDADALREVTDMPLFGTIPDDPASEDVPVVLSGDVNGPRTEAFKLVRTSLRYLGTGEAIAGAKTASGRRGRVLTITSGRPGEGKSMVSGNLAVELARDDRRVCLIECDLRRPRIMAYLGIAQRLGLSDLLAGDTALKDVRRPLLPGLDVIGAGQTPPNPSELLGSAGMKSLLDQLALEYDFVLLDSPPIIVTDPILLGGFSDDVLVVARARSTRRDDLTRTLEILSSTPVKGIVLNRVEKAARRGDSGYGTYHDYVGTGPSSPQPQTIESLVGRRARR